MIKFWSLNAYDYTRARAHIYFSRPEFPNANFRMLFIKQAPGLDVEIQKQHVSACVKREGKAFYGVITWYYS